VQGKATQITAITVLLLTAGAFFTIFFSAADMMVTMRNAMDKFAGQMMESDRLLAGEVVTGGDTEALEAAHAALISKAALAGEAARNSDSLHVGLISFRDVQLNGSRSYYSVTLNVGKLSRSATLLITDGPTHLTIVDPHVDQRAKLAFEGKSPLKVSNLPRGFLAGTRMSPFDAKRVSDFDSFENDKRQFCKTLEVWQQFFGVKLERVSVSRVYVNRDDPTVSVNDRGFRVSGRQVRKAVSAEDFCSSKI